MSQALYRKYRSLKLEDVLGQDHITSILRRALDKGRIAHAYLLSGPRGTGKTSVARILAHEINQLPYTNESNHIDIIEIDAASNNGVDDIRNLREKSRVAPVSAKYKVYVIDEVHMLSKSAFNALLKTLEEPPEHIVFIMATTDADKLPATILSRVQQYHFHPINSQTISKHLINIAKKEGFELTPQAADMIAERSNGGFRDSISLLDQLSSLADKDTPLDEGLVSASLGLPNQQLVDETITAYQSGDAKSITAALDNANNAGVATHTLVDQLLKTLRHKLTTEPQLIQLMKGLVDVPSHSHPDIKLLTVLMSELADREPKKRQTNSPLLTPRPKPVTVDVPVLKPDDPQPKPQPEPAAAPPKRKIAVAPSLDLKDFSWDKLIQDIRSQSIGLYSLVSKCGNEPSGSSLIIYSGTTFTKKKLEDPKNMQIITGIIYSQYGDNVEIEVRSGTKPPSDGKLAAVASLMGGGQEVSLEEIS